MTLNYDGKVLAMLELGGMWSTPSLPLLFKKERKKRVFCVKRRKTVASIYISLSSLSIIIDEDHLINLMIEEGIDECAGG